MNGLKNRKSAKSSTSDIFNRMFLMAFYTTAIVELSQVGIGLIDGIITSRCLGPMEMAAVGIGHPYFSITGIASGCLSVGMQTICTREFARGHIDKSNKVFSQAVLAGGIVSLLLAFVLIAFSSPVAGILGARGAAESLREPTRIYLTGLAIGTPGFILSAIFAPAIQLDNGSKDVLNAAIVCSVNNIVFDLLAAKLGWGVFGIGLASSISNYANLLVLLLHFRKKDRIIFLTFSRLEKKTIFEMVSLGMEKLVRRAANLIRPIMLNTIVISVGGSTAMTAMSVRNSLNNFVEIPATAIAGAVALLTGLFYGEINKDDIVNTGKSAHKYDLICTAALTVLTFIFAKPLAIFYVGADSEALPLLEFAIYCLAARLFFATLTLARVSYLQALHKAKRAQVLTILLNLVFVVFSAWILSIPFGAYGVMAAFPVSQILALITIYIYYAIKSRNPLPSSNEYMGLSRDFDLGPGDVIDLSITGNEDASLTAEMIMMFCKGHGIDYKRSYHAGLCAEEMAKIIIEHGFQSKKSTNSIDIRVVIRDNDLVIRLRDNCPSFNIAKQSKIVDDCPDPLSNTGIKIIQKTAKDISYYRTLETNNTIITV